MKYLLNISIKKLKMKNNPKSIHRETRDSNIDIMKTSVIDYLIKFISLSPLFRIIKLRQTTSLLESTDFTLGQIANVVGFKNEKELTYLFMNKYEMSPLAYRLRFQDYTIEKSA